MTRSISANLTAAQSALETAQATCPAGSQTVTAAQFNVNLWTWLGVLYANQSAASALLESVKAMGQNWQPEFNALVPNTNVRYAKIGGQTYDLSQYTA